MDQESSLVDQLLDAQVRYVVEQLSGDGLRENLGGDVDALLAMAGELRLDVVLDREAVKGIVRRLVATVPASVGASEVVEVAADVLYDGPSEDFAVGDLFHREQVEALIDEVLGLSPIVERALDRLTDSPLVGMVASRFMGRIVGEVLQANRAVAEKVPGLGSLMSFGTSAASKVMGAADKQFEQLLGDTAGKSAAFAVRRLNKIVVETMRDPTTREALLQVWDMVAREPVAGLAKYTEREDLYRTAHVAQGVVATAAATEQVGGLVDAFVDAFFDRYGDHPVTTLLDELGVSRDDLVADAEALTPGVIEAAKNHLVRSRLEPFFRSPEVTRLLGGQA